VSGPKYYNYFRDYDPSIGGYLQSDLVGLFGGSFSTYAYVAGNPLAFVDKNGLQYSNIVPPGAFGPIAPNEGQGYATQSQPHKATPSTPSSVRVPGVNDPCVEKYIHDHYGDFWGFVATIGNLEQFLPTDPDSSVAIPDGLEVAAEKLLLTEGPGVLGRRMIMHGTSNWSGVVGAEAMNVSSLWSGTGEVVGAIMTPFGSAAMEEAMKECTCYRKK
jgi:hypothetical protein